MGKKVVFTAFLIIVACLIVLSGCGKKELEQAKAEAAQAKVELAKTEVLLAKSRLEKEKLQTELDAVIGEQKELQDLVAAIKKEREEVMAKTKEYLSNNATLNAEVTKLKLQVGSQMEEIAGLRTEKEKLEATIKELQDKLKSINSSSLPEIRLDSGAILE